MNCIVKAENDSQNIAQEFNFAQIRTKVGLTTKSLFEKPCYKTLNYLEGGTLIK